MKSSSLFFDGVQDRAGTSLVGIQRPQTGVEAYIEKSLYVCEKRDFSIHARSRAARSFCPR